MTALADVRGDRAARVAWARLVEPGDREVAARIAAVGAEEALQSIGADTAASARMAGRLAELDVDRDFQIADTVGCPDRRPG